MFKGIVLLSALLVCLSKVSGHAKLYYPKPNRSGWNICAGIMLKVNRGKCGVCGQEYGEEQRRRRLNLPLWLPKNVKRTPVVSWSQGATVTITVHVTVSHGGGPMMFYICPHDKIHNIPLESCFIPLYLEQGGMEWNFPNGISTNKHKIRVRLPDGLVCWNCIFRWVWIAKITKERYYGCSFVSVGRARKPARVTTPLPERATPWLECHAYGAFKTVLKAYCKRNCTPGGRYAGTCYPNRCCCGRLCDGLDIDDS